MGMCVCEYASLYTFIALHCIASRCISLQTTPRCIALHCLALHCISLHATPHCVALQCVHTCVYMSLLCTVLHIYIYTQYVCVCPIIYICIHVYICTYACAHIYKLIYIYIYIHKKCPYEFTSRRLATTMCIYICMRIHMHIKECIHLHIIHIYI